MRTLTPLARVVLAAALACGCSPGAPLADLPARPGLNVIVVSFDALRADALGVYGYPLRTSPHIDAFAARGVVFENAYSVAAETAMSFAAFFTGRHPVRSFRNWRLVAERTLAESFASAGYATAGFVHNAHLSPVRGFGRGFQVYRVFTDLEQDDAAVLGAARAWIAARGDEPFFVWVHLIDPHNPWEVREGASHLYDPAYAGPLRTKGGVAFVEEDPVELARLRSLYDGEVFALDALFGGLVEDLRSRGLLERSLLLLTSDHGEEFMQHGHLQHGQLYEENLRIPLILHHPDLRGGRRVAALVSQLDLLPTLTSLAGIAPAEEVDGRDLRSVSEDADPLLAVAFGGELWRQASLRRGSRKLILECGTRVRAGERSQLQLYDLAADPGERHDLASVQPEVAQALLWELFGSLGIRGCEELRRGRPGEPDRELEGLDEKARRQLEALGYLEP